MPPGIISDHRMRNTVLAKFPGGQRGTLVARAGFIGPDVNRDTQIMCLVDRCQRGAPIYSCEPPRIAMGKNIDRSTSGL